MTMLRKIWHCGPSSNNCTVLAILSSCVRMRGIFKLWSIFQAMKYLSIKWNQSSLQIHNVDMFFKYSLGSLILLLQNIYMYSLSCKFLYYGGPNGIIWTSRWWIQFEFDVVSIIESSVWLAWKLGIFLLQYQKCWGAYFLSAWLVIYRCVSNYLGWFQSVVWPICLTWWP